jgi:hypothetical protein
MMDLRDDIERTLRSWDAYEKGRGAPPVVDFDCHPVDDEVAAAESRISVRDRLTQLLKRAEGAGEHRAADRIQASLAYLDTLLGAQIPLRRYVRLTQGCDALGWSADYVDAVGDVARNDLAAGERASGRRGRSTDRGILQPLAGSAYRRRPQEPAASRRPELALRDTGR